MAEGEKIAPLNIRPEVDEQIRRRAEAIALFMGGDYNMTVGVGPWGSGWHWDFVRNHVNMDAKDLATEPPDVVKGIASHEGNHRLVSRTDSLMDLWQEPGFAFGFNAVEDPRANEGGMKFMPGIRKWIQSYIERDLNPGGGLDYQGMEKEAKDKMGYVPDFMKWGAEMIRYWHKKEFAAEGKDSDQLKSEFLANIPDQAVSSTVEKTLDFFETFYKTLPDTKDEMDVRWKAKESAQNFRENIWPVYKDLVKKSAEDHSLVKMLQDMMQKGQEKGGQGTSQGQQESNEVDFSSLPKDVQDEIKKKVEDAAEKAANEGTKEQKGEGKDAQGGGGAGEQENEKGEGMSSKGPTIKIPWDQLSDKAKKDIKKAFDKLPQDKKENYKREAQRELEDVEDEANQNLRGKMNDPRDNETHKEKNEREQKEQAETNPDIQRAIKESDRKVKELMRDIPENTYHDYLKLPEIDAIRRQMERDLKKIFEPTESPDIKYSSSGLSPSMKRAMQMEADPRQSNIFESKGRPKERMFRFMFLLDLSSSMAGDTIEETFKTIIPVIECLNRFRIEFEVLGYQTDFPNTIKVYKSFDQKKLDQKSRDKIGEILGDVGGSTPSMEATRKAYKKLVQRIKKVNVGRNYFITLTDGDPTDSSYEDLAEYNNEIRKDKSIVTAGFGIGSGTEFVNKSYPQLPNPVKTAIARKLGKSVGKVSNSFSSASQFGEVFAIIAQHMVKRPELFSR